MKSHNSEAKESKNNMKEWADDDTNYDELIQRIQEDSSEIKELTSNQLINLSEHLKKLKDKLLKEKHFQDARRIIELQNITNEEITKQGNMLNKYSEKNKNSKMNCESYVLISLHLKFSFIHFTS